MFFHWRTTPAHTATESVSTEVLVFGPHLLVQAIVFHLLDEQIAAAVSHDSCDSAVRKLEERRKRVTVEKARWEAMSNLERLHWLVKQSHIAVEANLDGTAALMA